MSLKNSFFEKGRLKFATIKFTLGKFISPKKHFLNLKFSDSFWLSCSLIIDSVSSLSMDKTFQLFFSNSIVSLPAPHHNSTAFPGDTLRFIKLSTFKCGFAFFVIL